MKGPSVTGNASAVIKMPMGGISRREFLELSTTASLGLLVAACTAPASTSPAFPAEAAIDGTSVEDHFPPPFEVLIRPFAVDPITYRMLWDGLFDTSVGEQLIGVYFVPTRDSSSDPLLNSDPNRAYVLDIALEKYTSQGYTSAHPSGVSLQNASVAMPTQFIAGVPILGLIGADFSSADVGKYRLLFTPRLPGWTTDRIRWTFETPLIHVLKNNLNGATIETSIPEGILTTVFDEALVFPYLPSDEDPNNWKEYASQVPPFVLPTRFSLTWLPSQPYSGQFSPLPFQDEWLKDLSCAACSKAGQAAMTSMSAAACTFLPIIGCIIAMGVQSTVTPLACYKCQKEEIDIFRLGETATSPPEGELTIKEEVIVDVQYLDNQVGPGLAFRMNANWKYVRTTDQNTYEVSDSWEVANDFVIAKMVVKTDKPEYTNSGDWAIISTTLEDNQGQQLKGTMAYVTGVLIGPNDQVKPFVMYDRLETGEYQHSFVIEALGPTSNGNWLIYVLAQTVNKYVVPPNITDPAEAGQQAALAAINVGGVVFNKALAQAVPSSVNSCETTTLTAGQCADLAATSFKVLI